MRGLAAARRRGTLTASAAGGYGFVAPDDGGGELLVRGCNIETERELRAGETVLYSLAAGSFALEAVGVRLAPVDAQEENDR